MEVGKVGDGIFESICPFVIWVKESDSEVTIKCSWDNKGGVGVWLLGGWIPRWMGLDWLSDGESCKGSVTERLVGVPSIWSWNPLGTISVGCRDVGVVAPDPNSDGTAP